MNKTFGDVLKKLSVVIGVFGCIGSLIWGIIVLSQAANEPIVVVSNHLALSGFIIIFVGSALSIIISILVYGFGQLVESVQNIEYKLYIEESEDIEENDEFEKDVKPTRFKTIDLNCDEINC